jgi:hypothetical protein
LRKIKQHGRKGLGDVSRRIDNSGGQFWKRLRSIKDCNATRRRRGERRGKEGEEDKEEEEEKGEGRGAGGEKGK